MTANVNRSFVHQNKKSGVILIVLLLLTGTQSVHSQEHASNTIEDLSNDSFENLSRAYEELKGNKVLAEPFARAFLLKAKLKKEKQRQGEGYFKMANVQTDELIAIQYLDSVIEITKENPTNRFPVEAYIRRGQLNGAHANFKQAMDDFGSANTYANKNQNEDQKNEIKYFIALLKNVAGEYEEGMVLLKETLIYFEDKAAKGEKYNELFIRSLYAVGNQFNTLEQPDSSLHYLKIAIDLSLKTEKRHLYDRLLFTAAISHRLKTEYEASIDSLKRCEEVSKEMSVGLSVTMNIYSVFGSIYAELNKKEMAFTYYKKVDSLAIANDFFPYSMKTSYEFLISYYEEKNNEQEELIYIDRLLKLDSNIRSNEVYVSKNLDYQYETPNLLLKKEELINNLEEKNDRGQILLISLAGFSLIALFLLIWNYRKQKNYKKRFQELLDKTNTETTVPKEIKSGKANPEKMNDIGISQEVIDHVLEKLTAFETEKGFLQMNITVSSLAKEFDTNSKYFSKIINTYKRKSFTNYVNELRINYVIEELKINPKFRKYTIQAIANEIGFNTSEAFSKYFYKMTGIYPSFFIKELEKQVM